jgi:hypothetical protein
MTAKGAADFKILSGIMDAAFYYASRKYRANQGNGLLEVLQKICSLNFAHIKRHNAM